MLGPVEARYAIAVGDVDPFALADDFLLPLEVAIAPGDGHGRRHRPGAGGRRAPRCPPCDACPAASRCACGIRRDEPTTATILDGVGWVVDLRGRPVASVRGSDGARPVGDPHDPHATLARLTTRSAGRARISLIVALALVFGGCGRFSSSSSSESSGTTVPGEIGVGLTVPTSPTTSSPARAATTQPASRCAHSDPTSEIRYDRGLTIELTVTPLCPAHADDIRLTMKVTNTSGSAIRYDVNQTQFFTIKAPRGEQKRRWEDTDCNKPTGGGDKPAATLAAGASVTIAGTYPAAAGVANREMCRRLELGAYDAGRGLSGLRRAGIRRRLLRHLQGHAVLRAAHPHHARRVTPESRASPDASVVDHCGSTARALSRVGAFAGDLP